MCGRYQAWIEDDELMRIIEREKRGNVMRYFRQNEVFPGSIVPVLYGSYSTVRAHLSFWGYDLGEHGKSSSSADSSESFVNNEEKAEIPRSGSRKGGSLLINARSETAASKLMFRDSLLNSSTYDRRVIIVTSGYFEWDSGDIVNGRKARYHIRSGTSGRYGEPLLLCGLETAYENGAAGSVPEYRHVILTTAAYGSPSKIHHRMPLFLRREEMQDWLYDTEFALRKLRERIPCDLRLCKA